MPVGFAQIHFSAEGKMLPAFRSALRDAGIRCRHQQVQGGRFYAEIRTADHRSLTALAKEHNIQITVMRQTGLLHRLRPYRMRVGILFGLLLGAGFLFWSNAYVRSIEISGCSELSEAEILTALESLGVTRGTRIRDIPFTYIEQRMRLAVSDIEWIALRCTGGRLSVELTEERDAPQKTNDRTATNYIATVPAQITDISVLGGHAVHKVGDAVKAGELLITGIEEDSRGITRYYHADGVVTGIYEAEFTREQPFVSEIAVRGNTKTQTVLELFGKRIPLSPAFSQPDGDIIYEEDAVTPAIFGYALPCTLLHCRYTQQAAAITVYSEQEATALLEEAALRFEQNFHADDTILARNVSFQQNDLGISLKINYVFEGVIGKTSEIFVKLS